MLITSITIENFKGIAEPVTVPLKPLTLLFGKNSAGKSTILQAMLYALEIIKNGNCDPDRVELGGTSIDLGGFANLVHKHETDRTVKLRFDLDLSREAWVRPEGTLAADRGVKRREFRIDEYIPEWMSERGIDLSTIGDDAETAWVELAVGQIGEDFHPQVLYWEVGFDGTWLARVGRYTRRWMREFIAQPVAVLNEVHPLLTLTEGMEETPVGTVYGMFGRSFQSMLYHAYYVMEEAENPPGGDSPDWSPVNTGEPFDESTMRVVELHGNMFFELGVLADGGGLAVRQYHATGTDNSALTSALYQMVSVDEHPKMLSLGANGLPDWDQAFTTGWPISLLRGRYTGPYGTSSSSEPEPGEDLPVGPEAVVGARFLDQLLERLLYGPLVWLRDELDSTRYLGPLRELPLRDSKTPRTPDRERWASGLGGWDALNNDPALVDIVNSCLANDLKISYQLEHREIVSLDTGGPLFTFMESLAWRYDDFTGDDFREMVLDELDAMRQPQLTLIDTRRNIPVAPADIGVGISQVLPVVTGAFAYTNGEPYCGIFAVEQPELHVHPAVQVGLGDVFIRAIRENPDRLMLIETHSEHMTLRLMRRMRETFEGTIEDEILKATPDDIAILFVEVYESRTLVRQMPINERGELVKAWPGGFYEEDLEEIL